MTMNDLCKRVGCKYITWSSGRESCTAWLECKLKKCITDEEHCAKCKDRLPKGAKPKKETVRVISKCPICGCEKYEGISFYMSAVFCKSCGCVYKQVIHNPCCEHL